MTPGGVAFLDHTADVGFDAAAPTAPELFHASALAMLALLRGEEDAEGPPRAEPGQPGPTRRIELEAPDPPRLLADWLRELLFLHEVEALDYARAAFDTLQLERGPCRLGAGVELRPGGRAIREIKGVTYHEIEARPTRQGWVARVIFDV